MEEEARLTGWIEDGLIAAMQIRRSSLRGADRPDCSCAGTVREGRLKVHCHGGYHRNRRADGEQRVWIEQFLCVRCGQTFTVIPEDMLPYRPIEVSKLEGWLDAVYQLKSEVPKITEKEKGCLRRAERKFVERTPSLIQILGQMIESVGSSARRLWHQIRRIGELGEILQLLAENFKSSVLGDYRCLRRSRPLKGV